MKKPLFVLLGCLFVAMIGFGIRLPVLPFYVERLALGAGASLGAQNTANSLGQAGGPLLGGVLHLADERAVFVLRRSVAGTRSGYRVESDAWAA